VSPPNRDKLTMRFKPLKRLDLILSLSKDEDTFSGFFSSLLKAPIPLSRRRKSHLAKIKTLWR
jgi:hypothetical protein